LENIGLYEEAVGTYVQGTLFEKAKTCATQVKNQQVIINQIIKKVNFS
jgi:hypothetical protein